MLRLTKELVAEAVANGTLHTLAEPVASALLDGSEGIDDCLKDVEHSAMPSIALVLNDLIDLACAHGDEQMRRMPGLVGWHTIGLSVLLRANSDHQLRQIGDARALERQMADALGLDYGSLRVGPYALPAVAALGSSAEELARTTAAMRLEAARTMPEGAWTYGFNERGTKEVALAHQVQLCISVKATSAEDARQMARELHQWAISKTRSSKLGFFLVDGSQLEVDCVALMAGLPWSLRSMAAYEIQSLVMFQLAANFESQHARVGEKRYFSTVLEFDDDADVCKVKLAVWFGDDRRNAYAAVLSTAAQGHRLDEKLTSKLLSAGWVHVELDPGESLLGAKAAIGTLEYALHWDPRFAA